MVTISAPLQIGSSSACEEN